MIGDRNRPRIVTAVFSAWLVAATAMAVFAQESRIFTNREGQKIDAVLLDVQNSVAKVRRVSDQTVFEIPVGSLSLDDQAWMAAWIKQHAAIGPGQWRTFQVDLPSPLDTADVIGLDAGIGARRIGGTTWEFDIPWGAWIKLKVYSNDGSGELMNHLLRYTGEAHWQLGTEGKLLTLSKGGGDTKIAGITLPYRSASGEIQEDQEQFLRRIDRDRLAASLSVDVPYSVKTGTLNILQTPIAAITSKSVLNSNLLIKFSDLKPLAIEFTMQPDAVEALGSFGTTEAMFITCYRDNRPVPQFNVQADTEKALARIVFPPLRDLSLSGFYPTEPLGEALSKLEHLRLFELATPSSSSGPRPPGPAASQTNPRKWWNPAGNRKLESMHVSSGVGFLAADISQLSALKSLRISNGMFSTTDENLTDLTSLRELRQLSVSTSSFADEVLDQWAESGGLKNLLKLSGYHSPNFEKTPNLEVLSLYESSGSSSSASSKRLDLSQFSQLKNLRNLYLTGAGQRDIEALAALPAKNKLKVLRFYSGSFHDATMLHSFPGIARLELRSHRGSLRELDLAPITNLEYLSLRTMPEIESLKGVADHPSLQGLRITSCDVLSSLGSTAANGTLRMLHFSRCPQLADLSALHQSTGLKQLQIFNCHALSEPLLLDDINELEYISVLSCDNLKDRRMMER